MRKVVKIVFEILAKRLRLFLTHIEHVQETAMESGSEVCGAK